MKLLAAVFTFKRPVTSLTASSGKMLAQEQKTGKVRENTGVNLSTATNNNSIADQNIGFPDDEPVVVNPFDDIIEVPEAPEQPPLPAAAPE